MCLSSDWRHQRKIWWDLSYCSTARLRIPELYPLRRHKKKGVISMKLNCILFWGSSSGDLERTEYSSLTLLPDLLWPGGVVSVRVPSMSQVDQFNNYLYSIGPCAKILLRNNTKTYIWTYNKFDSLTFWYRIIPEGLKYRLNQSINSLRNS